MRTPIGFGPKDTEGTVPDVYPDTTLQDKENSLFP